MTTRKSAYTNDSGVALAAVLLVATILAGVAVALLILAQQIAQADADISADVENRALLEAGLNRMILAYERPGDSLREKLVGDGRPVEWDFAGQKLTLRVQAESGKLDLNAGHRDHIAALVARLVPEAAAQSLFLSGLDAARSEGQLILSVLSLLSPFDRMTARREVIEAHFTVLTGQHGFDPRTALNAVIETAPGLPDEAKQEILSARASGRAFSVNRIPFAPAQMFVTEKPVYSLRAETHPEGRPPAAMAAQVEFSNQGRIAIFSWATATPKLYQ